jgi:hypothetical protein
MFSELHEKLEQDAYENGLAYGLAKLFTLVKGYFSDTKITIKSIDGKYQLGYVTTRHTGNPELPVEMMIVSVYSSENLNDVVRLYSKIVEKIDVKFIYTSDEKEIEQIRQSMLKHGFKEKDKD